MNAAEDTLQAILLSEWENEKYIHMNNNNNKKKAYCFLFWHSVWDAMLVL